jgi:NAD+ kinase
MYSKSGGNTPSPNTPDATGMPPSFSQSQQRPKSASAYQSGVDTPDRFVTHCEPPPALSQRHLVDKLVGAAAEMEISRKDNEDGQRDHIRSDANEMRVDDGQHMIPSGRNLVITSPSDRHHSQPNGEQSGKPVPSPNPRRLSHSQAQSQSQARARSRSRSQTRRPAHMDRSESKAKAFAFFGQVSLYICNTGMKLM